MVVQQSTASLEAEIQPMEPAPTNCFQTTNTVVVVVVVGVVVVGDGAKSSGLLKLRNDDYYYDRCLASRTRVHDNCAVVLMVRSPNMGWRVDADGG